MPSSEPDAVSDQHLIKIPLHYGVQGLVLQPSRANTNRFEHRESTLLLPSLPGATFEHRDHTASRFQPESASILYTSSWGTISVTFSPAFLD